MKLGDKFPRKLLLMRKSVLDIGLVELNTVMDSLSLKLYLGNKRSKGELASVIKHHEELSLDDSGFPKTLQELHMT